MTDHSSVPGVPDPLSPDVTAGSGEESLPVMVSFDEDSDAKFWREPGSRGLDEALAEYQRLKRYLGEVNHRILGAEASGYTPDMEDYNERQNLFARMNEVKEEYERLRGAIPQSEEEELGGNEMTTVEPAEPSSGWGKALEEWAASVLSKNRLTSWLVSSDDDAVQGSTTVSVGPGRASKMVSAVGNTFAEVMSIMAKNFKGDWAYYVRGVGRAKESDRKVLAPSAPVDPRKKKLEKTHVSGKSAAVSRQVAAVVAGTAPSAPKVPAVLSGGQDGLRPGELEKVKGQLLLDIERAGTAAAKMEVVALFLDHYGLDVLASALPFGDGVATGISFLYTVWQGRKLNLAREDKARIAGYYALDAAVGSLPEILFSPVIGKPISVALDWLCKPNEYAAGKFAESLKEALDEARAKGVIESEIQTALSSARELKTRRGRKVVALGTKKKQEAPKDPTPLDLLLIPPPADVPQVAADIQAQVAGVSNGTPSPVAAKPIANVAAEAAVAAQVKLNNEYAKIAGKYLMWGDHEPDGKLSGKAAAYAKTLYTFFKADKGNEDKFKQRAGEMVAECNRLLKRVGLEVSDFDRDDSWAYWDVAEQMHLSQGNAVSGVDLIGDAMSDENVRKSLAHRHFGVQVRFAWEGGGKPSTDIEESISHIDDKDARRVRLKVLLSKPGTVTNHVLNPSEYMEVGCLMNELLS